MFWLDLTETLLSVTRTIPNLKQVTVVEVHDRKPYKIIDRRRELKKGVMADSLEELIERGQNIIIIKGNNVGMHSFMP